MVRTLASLLPSLLWHASAPAPPRRSAMAAPPWPALSSRCSTAQSPCSRSACCIYHSEPGSGRNPAVGADLGVHRRTPATSVALHCRPPRRRPHASSRAQGGVRRTSLVLPGQKSSQTSPGRPTSAYAGELAAVDPRAGDPRRRGPRSGILDRRIGILRSRSGWAEVR